MTDCSLPASSKKRPDLIADFSISRLPRIAFGAGVVTRLPTLAAGFGSRVLIVTGSRSVQASSHWNDLERGLRDQSLDWSTFSVPGEPSPKLVDDAVKKFGDDNINVVVGIGGGSAMDAAKAIAGLLIPGNSVMDHLEGVGPEHPYSGPSVPFIAVPTTAGSGSEATKNAVLSVRGEGGFKKSFRDERLVAELAVVDPDLLATCPPDIIAANGMDALTQLLEGYVSTRANPMTDALALSGLVAVRDGLRRMYSRADDGGARSQMAYAALLSGIVLAQVGLGSVHGLASPIGAFFEIPHGVVCGTLVATATRVNISALSERDHDGIALDKYANVGRLLTNRPELTDVEARDQLLELLDRYSIDLELPQLGVFGVARSDIARIVAGSRGSSMKTNPIVLEDSEIAAILEDRI